MTIVHQARTALVAESTVTVDHVVELHAALVPDQSRHHGLRAVQNWIGGSDHHPLDAEFVPPAAERVPGLMGDLVAYLNGASHSPVIQAGLVHAQFETIHPFTDGNGRVGRALIHTILTRRGLTTAAVLPVSMVLSTLRDDYVAGLTAYRHADPVGSERYHAAREQWLDVFVRAVITASTQAASLVGDLGEMRADWDERLAGARARAGKKRSARSDSSTALIMRDLPATPILTSATVQRIHGVSRVAADRALDELQSAGILHSERHGGQRFFQARDVLNLITLR